jgi:hypothetical protein
MASGSSLKEQAGDIARCYVGGARGQNSKSNFCDRHEAKERPSSKLQA